MINGVAAGLTLMAVCAHPDDESTSVGGALARYADEGARTIVVTCTGGEFGDGLGGVKPGEHGHDGQAVAAIRLAEFKNACRCLKVYELEVLGYHDSGLADWGYRHQSVFCNVAAPVVAARVGELLNRYRPQVIITHNANDELQHPDHVHAGQSTALAVEMTDIPAKLYFKAHGTSYWNRIREALAQVGIVRVAPDSQQRQQWDCVERQITTTIDVKDVIDRKREALMAHSSQLNSSLAAKIPAELWPLVFGAETFIRVHDTTRAPTPEDDLFAGLRPGG